MVYTSPMRSPASIESSLFERQGVVLIGIGGTVTCHLSFPSVCEGFNMVYVLFLLPPFAAR